MLSKQLSEMLASGAQQLDKKLDAEELNKFALYVSELKEWNKKFNLTAITKDEDIVTKHFLDSLLLIRAFRFSGGSIVDIGAGAGFPGIPLKIIFPGIKLTLLDSVKKKTSFLEHITELLCLKDVNIVCARAEDAAKSLRESFDVSCARAVAPLRTLAEYCLPLTKPEGFFLALKGEKVEQEVKEAEKAFHILGGKLVEVKKINLPGTSIIRSVVVVKKTGKTPLKYPRSPGQARKNPL